ncbi:hypothetical protein A176_005863 [Myxococcus hansupus]|uniref:Uncharacterized protein n=1 Tax=Pseudomyxococcus hansupus TaxID=1297742 RepID=A0A0H4WZT5_9BACT|nr:hypothetical protein A176_005863 [Myxococcus hansupus]
MPHDSEDAAHGALPYSFRAVSGTGTHAPLVGIPPDARVVSCGQSGVPKASPCG